MSKEGHRAGCACCKQQDGDVLIDTSVRRRDGATSRNYRVERPTPRSSGFGTPLEVVSIPDQHTIPQELRDTGIGMFGVWNSDNNIPTNQPDGSVPLARMGLRTGGALARFEGFTDINTGVGFVSREMYSSLNDTEPLTASTSAGHIAKLLTESAPASGNQEYWVRIPQSDINELASEYPMSRPPLLHALESNGMHVTNGTVIKDAENFLNVYIVTRKPAETA